MLDMSVSVLIPVKNEEEGICGLLDGLLAQTKKPGEVVICDGGSTDETRRLIREYAKNSKIPIKLIEVNQAYPGEGRNIAAAHAQGNWFACIDAGCRPDESWLCELVKMIPEGEAQGVVFGACLPDSKTLFEKCSAAVTITQGFWYSVASMLVHRDIWDSIGGFPKELRTAEDEVFIKKILASNYPTVVAPAAIVYWRPRSTLGAFFRQSYSYYKGKAIIGSDFLFVLRKTLFYFFLGGLLLWGMVNGYCLLASFVLFVVWVAMSVFRHIGRAGKLLCYPAAHLMFAGVVLFRDIGTIAGYCDGMITRKFAD